MSRVLGRETLAGCQAYAKQFSADHGWDQEPLETRLCFLMTEVGELTQAALRSGREPEADGQSAAGLEIFDVIWNTVDVANHLGIDIEQCLRDRMAINADRMWPVRSGE